MSESVSSKAATVGDGGMTSGSKYEGAGDPCGVKNCSLMAMISSLLIEGEGDTWRGGISRGNEDDEEVGDGVVMRDGTIGGGVSACWAFRKMCKCMGSSPVNTAGGSGP